MLNALDPGVDRAIHGPVVVRVHENVRTVVFGHIHSCLHFIKSELRHVDGIELTGHAAAGHDFYLCSAGTEVVACCLHHFGTTADDVPES